MTENIQAEFTQTLRKTCKNLYLRALKPMTRQQGKHPMNKLHLSKSLEHTMTKKQTQTPRQHQGKKESQ